MGKRIGVAGQVSPSENREGKKGVVPEISGHELLLLLKLVDFPLCTSVPPNLLVAKIAPLMEVFADRDLDLVPLFLHPPTL